MTLTYISCSSDFYTFYIPLSLGYIIPKVSAEDIAIRGNGTGQEYMCPIRHFVYTFFNPVFQVSTAKNEINLFNNHILIVAPVTFAPAGAMTPSAEFLFNKRSGAVVMSPDSEGLGAAVVAGVGSSLTQSSGISYFSLYIYIHCSAVITRSLITRKPL